MGGTIGAILTGVFASTLANPGLKMGGLLQAGNVGQVKEQAIAVLVTYFYAGVVSFIIMKIVGLTGNPRLSDEEEMIGLDQTQHGETGYTI